MNRVISGIGRQEGRNGRWLQQWHGPAIALLTGRGIEPDQRYLREADARPEATPLPTALVPCASGPLVSCHCRPRQSRRDYRWTGARSPMGDRAQERARRLVHGFHPEPEQSPRPPKESAIPRNWPSRILLWGPIDRDVRQNTVQVWSRINGLRRKDGRLSCGGRQANPPACDAPSWLNPSKLQGRVARMKAKKYPSRYPTMVPAWAARGLCWESFTS
jgi:hypothetical protein